MRRFVLLKKFSNPKEALVLATIIMNRLDGTLQYFEGWSWATSTKTYPNGVMGQGPTILQNGTCDVLGIRQNLPDGSDIYCQPDMKEWIEGGMQGTPPRPHPALDGGVVATGITQAGLSDMVQKLDEDYAK